MRFFSMKFFSTLVLSLIVLYSTAASALDLQAARSQGLVTEQPNGFLAAAKPSPEVTKLVNEVNAGRQAEYARISKENGQPVDVVGKLAAEQIKKNLGK